MAETSWQGHVAMDAGLPALLCLLRMAPFLRRATRRPGHAEDLQPELLELADGLLSASIGHRV